MKRTKRLSALLAGSALLAAGTGFAQTQDSAEGQQPMQPAPRAQQQQQQREAQQQNPRQQPEPSQQRAPSAQQEASGKVSDIRSANAKANEGTAQNQIVVLETEKGQHIAVDLGPRANLKDVQVKRGTPLTVKGTIVNIEGEPVFLAQQFKLGEMQRTVQRAESERQPVSGHDTQQKVMPSKQLQGTIDKLREVKVQGDSSPHMVGILRTDQDLRLYTDFGPKSQLKDAKLAQGARVQVKGYGIDQSGNTVLVVQQLTKNGNTIQIERKQVPQVAQQFNQQQPNQQQPNQQQPNQQQPNQQQPNQQQPH